MTINKYIKNIQQEIGSGKPYEEYVHWFEEYKKYLESVIEQNPRDIVAICQLAAVLMELRYDSDDSIKIITKALFQFESELTDNEKVRLYTNLAFFYKESGDEDKLIVSLNKAIALKPNMSNAYDALAVCLTAKAEAINGANDCKAALPLFEQAAKISDEFRYQYNYAVALYSTGNITNAKIIFEKLYHHNDSNMKAAYGLGICSYYLGSKEMTLDIANRLASVDADDEVSEAQIAELFYLCDDYANHNAMFDNCKIRYHYDISWLSPYFYCLKTLGKDIELTQKYNEVIESKIEDIEDVKGEVLEDNHTVEDLNEHAAGLQKELDDIKEAYHKIMNENYRPEVSPKLHFVYGCYLIDCPRHQRILEAI